MRWALAAVLGILVPPLAWADSQPSFYEDASNGCSVGTFHPQPEESVRWTGPCVGGKAQGRGIAEWSSRGQFFSRSEGEYRAGLREGRVISTTADGTRNESEFRDGKTNGRCIITASDGSRFDGQCADDVYNGTGRAHYAGGDRYYGDFRDGQKDGHGVYVWKDGSVYDGSFAADKRSGRGKMVSTDRSWYAGEWRDGKTDGEGVEVFDDGAYYQGHWSDGHPDGFGQYVGIGSRGKPNVWTGQWSQGCFSSDGMTAAITTTRADCGFE
jgi:hypothetical protein